MARRTRFRQNEALAVLHSTSWPIFLSPAQAAAAELQVHEIDLCLYLCEPGDEIARDEIFVYVTTPAALFSEWTEFLTPPLFDTSEPLFSLEAWEICRNAPLGTVLVEDVEMESEDEEHQIRALRILINADHLDAATLQAAVIQGLWEYYPDIAAHYRVAWEQEYSPELVRSLVEYEARLLAADRASSREEFIRCMTEADRLWFDQLLLLKDQARATRLIQDPDYLRQAEAHAEAYYDRKFSEWEEFKKFESEFEEAVHEEALSEEELYGLINDPELFYAQILALAEWERRYSDLPVSRALQWLDRIRGWKAQ